MANLHSFAVTEPSSPHRQLALAAVRAFAANRRESHHTRSDQKKGSGPRNEPIGT